MNASYMRIPKKLELIKYEIFEDSNEYSKTRIQMHLRILINIIVILWPIKIWLWQIGVSLHLHFAINLEKFIILNTTQKILLFGNNINMNLSIINIFYDLIIDIKECLYSIKSCELTFCNLALFTFYSSVFFYCFLSWKSLCTSAIIPSLNKMMKTIYFQGLFAYGIQLGKWLASDCNSSIIKCQNFLPLLSTAVTNYSFLKSVKNKFLIGFNYTFYP